MELVARAAALCVAAALLALTLRRWSPEQAMLLAVAAAIAVFFLAAGGLGELLAFLRELAGRSGLPSELFAPLYKTLAIALVVRVGGGLCRDAGESALAAAVEAAGSVCALLAALPLLRSVLEMLTELLR